MAVKSATKSSAKPKPKHRRRSLLTWLFYAGLIGLLLVVVGWGAFGIVMAPHYAWAEKEIFKLDSYGITFASQPTTIVSADGKVLYRSIDRFQKPVKFPDIPEIVKDATLAVEDERFYSHDGVDYRSALRAIFSNIREGEATGQGASTISMQVAKAITGNDKTMDRKLKNVALAMKMEERKTKPEILKLYLNNSFYGAFAYGVGAAAEVYFGKELNELTIAEAALLARLVQRPSEYNPFRNPDLAVEKRNVVLRKLREQDKITEAEYQEAIVEPLKLKKDPMRAGNRLLASPYFVNYVLDSVKRTHPEIDLSKGGIRIETTLNYEMQEFAEAAVERVVRQYRKRGLTTGAFVCMDYNGQILAMVGGADYEKRQYNAISQGSRQPGSAMKPFVYAAALSTGALGFNEPISNEPHYLELGGGRTKKWPTGGGKGGMVSIQRAIAGSINVPAAWVMDKVGPNTAANYCRDIFGFDSPLDPVSSLVLGSSAVSPLEMAQGYSVFMLYGDRATPYGITRIVGPDGTSLADFAPKVIQNILDQRVAEYMDDCLRSVVTGGTARRAAGIPNARGKTGTTQDNRDAWFCGYTNNLVGIGWVANEQFHNGKPSYAVMPGVFGGEVTVQIWTEFMRNALKKYDDTPTRTKKRMKALPTLEAESEKLEPDPAQSDSNTPPELPDNGYPDQVPPLDPSGKAKGGNGTPQPDPPQITGEPIKTQAIPEDKEKVTVELCAESGLRASPYCPETVSRRFSKSGIPAKCRQHGP